MNISAIDIYITRLASNEIFSPSNKLQREVGQAQDLTAPLYITPCYLFTAILLSLTVILKVTECV
jgi:hypothetical protein